MKLPLPSNIVTNVAIGAAALAVLYVVIRGTKGAAADVAKAAVDVPIGVVLGVSDAVGIPRTDKTECEKALAEGRYWDASFACPAGTFLRGWVFGDNGPKSSN